MGAINDEMRCFSVQRITRRMKFLQFGEWIFNMQQRSVSVMARAFIQQPGRDIEVDHPAGVVQPTSILRIDHNPATGGHNQITPSSQFMDGLGLSTTKPVFTFDFKNRRNGYPGSFHDLMIRIEELPRQAFGKHAPNGGLSRPHQAD